MYFERIYESGLAHASYLIGCQASGTALVIDPKRDVDTYVEIARREKLQITHVTETHIHADFLSGARELSELTGAELLLSDEGGSDWQYAFEHLGLRHGQIIPVGNLEFKVLHTPGHTPEHISFLLSDRAARAVPLMMFTGDFVFVGDVGRPDLLEKAAGMKGTQEKGARQMWESLEIFRALPEFIQVWPAHGAGSACGKALGSVPSTTVGYEKRVGWAFKLDREAFTRELLSGQPEAPRYFAMMKKLNKEKRKLLSVLPRVPELDLARVDLAMADGAAVLDVRNSKAFAAAHIPGSLSIPLAKSLSTWAGWLLDYDRDIVLVAAPGDVIAAQRALIRIGLDRILGFVPDVALWREAGRKTSQLQQILPADASSLLTDQRALMVDVRGQVEHQVARIPGAVNIHGGHLLVRTSEVPKDRPVILQCNSGGSSAIATSVLKSLGYESVYNLEGGIQGWIKNGLPVERKAG